MSFSLLFWVNVFVYTIGWIFCCISFFSNEKLFNRWGESVLRLGLVLQLILIILGYFRLGDVLFDTLSSLFLFLSFCTILIFVVIDIKFPNQIFKIIFPPVAMFFLVLSITISDQVIVAKEFLAASPVFGKTLLFVHASSSMLGYLLFGVACLTSMFFLYQENKIKSKKLHLQDLKVPSLGFLDKLNYKIIAVGFLLLSIGLLLGINMKVIVTSQQMQLSLRQLLPVATWLIYALFLMDRFINGLRGKITAMWSIVGFCMAVTSFTYEVYLLTQRS